MEAIARVGRQIFGELVAVRRRVDAVAAEVGPNCGRDRRRRLRRAVPSRTTTDSHSSSTSSVESESSDRLSSTSMIVNGNNVQVS